MFAAVVADAIAVEVAEVVVLVDEVMAEVVEVVVLAN